MTAESKEPTVRIVWHDGHAYPVSNNPPGAAAGGEYWYVLLSDGWHPTVECPSSELEWATVEPKVLEWLANRRGGGRAT